METNRRPGRPKTSGAGPEWLKATYDQTVYATGLRVHETYNPGFITGIDLVEPNGTVHALSIPADTTACGGYYELTFRGDALSGECDRGAHGQGRL